MGRRAVPGSRRDRPRSLLRTGRALIRYPIRRGELYDIVAVFRSAAFERGAPDWGGPDELDARLATACVEVRRGVALVAPLRGSKTYDREPLGRWATGRVAALLGDTAHPLLQYLGQGACQALEDVEALGPGFTEHGDAYPKVLAEYGQERVPAPPGCQTTARTWGEIWHTDGVGRVLRNHILNSRARRRPHPHGLAVPSGRPLTPTLFGSRSRRACRTWKK